MQLHRSEKDSGLGVGERVFGGDEDGIWGAGETGKDVGAEILFQGWSVYKK